MRITYVSQYYPPEIGAPAARVSELSRAWAAAGHDVTVVTSFPQHPVGVKRPGDRGVLFREEVDPVEPRVRLRRCYIRAARNSGFWRRSFSYASFMASAMAWGGRRLETDIVIATSPQLFTAVAGWQIARSHRVPFVFEVRDLWPESIEAVGASKSSLVLAPLRLLAARLYEAADHIVTVGPGYRRGLRDRHGVADNRMSEIPNGVDLKHFRFSAERRQATRRRHGWDDDFVVLYLGTHGMAHGLETVLRAADRLRDRRGIRFVLAGDGAEKPALVARAAEMGLSNVSFLDAVDKAGTLDLYSAADVGLVVLRDRPLFAEVLPSKLFEIMGMSLPVIASAAGDAAAVVRRADAGWCVAPEDPAALADAVIDAMDSAPRCRTCGDNGRAWTEKHACRQSLAHTYVTLLEHLTQVPAGNRLATRTPQAGSAMMPATRHSTAA